MDYPLAHLYSFPHSDLLVGAIVEVLEGKHTGKRGKIVELKEKGDGTVAKLSLLDKTNEVKQTERRRKDNEFVKIIDLRTTHTFAYLSLKTIKVWSDEIALIKRSPRQQQSSEMGGTSSSTSSGKNLNNTKSWLRPAIRVVSESKKNYYFPLLLNAPITPLYSG